MTDKTAAQELIRIQKAWEAEFPEEDHSAIPMITRLGIFYGYYRSAYENLLKQYGLRTSDYHVLGTLRSYGSKTPLSPSALSKFSLQNKAGMTRALDRLEKAKLIKRHPNATDRRSLDIVLTKRGSNIAEKAYRSDMEFAQQLLAGFPMSDQEQFRDFLDRLIRNITNKVMSRDSRDINQVLNKPGSLAHYIADK